MKDYYNKGLVIAKLKKIFTDRCNFSYDKYDEEYLGKNLLGYEINLNARDLVYIFFDIENEFEISIPESFIINGNFSNLKSITDIVMKLVNSDA